MCIGRLLLSMKGDAMAQRNSYAEAYIKGYEDGLREAWEEFLSLTSKGFNSREMQILVKGQRMAIKEKVENKRRRMPAEADLLEQADLESKPSPKTPQEPRLEARPANLYLIKDRDLNGPMDHLKRHLASGGKALCILRTPPDSVRQRFGVDCQTVWLTKTEVLRQEEGLTCELVSPTDLPRLNTMIKTFLSENKGGHIILEGMEYLITQNDFKNVLKFIQGVRDQVILAKGMMMIPVDPGALEERELKALEREVA
ncbi:MAG: DUF835 domain-containing protein [Methanomassiliicoccales archaeon]